MEVNGLGSISLLHIDENVLKMSIQKLFNLGHPQNIWIRSAGSKPHLGQDNSFFSLVFFLLLVLFCEQASCEFKNIYCRGHVWTKPVDKINFGSLVVLLEKLHIDAVSEHSHKSNGLICCVVLWKNMTEIVQTKETKE